MDVVWGNKLFPGFLNYSRQQHCQGVQVDTISQANFTEGPSTKLETNICTGVINNKDINSNVKSKVRFHATIS
jgi:hypothetical protein